MLFYYSINGLMGFKIDFKQGQISDVIRLFLKKLPTSQFTPKLEPATWPIIRRGVNPCYYLHIRV